MSFEPGVDVTRLGGNQGSDHFGGHPFGAEPVEIVADGKVVFVVAELGEAGQARFRGRFVTGCGFKGKQRDGPGQAGQHGRLVALDINLAKIRQAILGNQLVQGDAFDGAFKPVGKLGPVFAPFRIQARNLVVAVEEHGLPARLVRDGLVDHGDTGKAPQLAGQRFVGFHGNGAGAQEGKNDGAASAVGPDIKAQLARTNTPAIKPHGAPALFQTLIFFCEAKHGFI